MNDDAVVEPTESFFLIIENPFNAVINEALDRATANIFDDDTYTELSIEGLEIIEGNSGNIQITRVGDLDIETSITLKTISGSATESLDFTPLNTTVNFSVGEDTQQVNFQSFADLLVEGTETLSVQLSDPSEGSIILNGSAEVSILDEDFPAEVSINNIQLTENTGLATFTLTRSGDLDHSTLVNYETVSQTAVDGTDYTHTEGSVTFEVGQEEILIAVPILDNNIEEDSRSFTLKLDIHTPGDLLIREQGMATILDDDQQTHSTFSVEAPTQINEGNSGSQNVSFTIRRTGKTDIQATVDYAVGNLNDGSLATRSIFKEEFSTNFNFNGYEIPNSGGLKFKDDIAHSGYFRSNNGRGEYYGNRNWRNNYQTHSVIYTGNKNVYIAGNFRTKVPTEPMDFWYSAHVQEPINYYWS